MEKTDDAEGGEEEQPPAADACVEDIEPHDVS